MFAKRIKNIRPFKVMQINELAMNMERRGHRVFHFEVGEPDFPTAKPIAEAATRAIELGQTKYTDSLGIPELRKAIAEFYSANNVEVSWERVVITTGASGGLMLLSALLMNQGDELLVTDPGYPPSEAFAALVNVRPKRIPLDPTEGFQLTSTHLATHWEVNKTRGLLISSPSNPTGIILGADSIGDLSEYINRVNGFFVVDEVYQGLVYDKDAAFSTALAVDQGIYIVNSFSKFFGMTGWRIGWMVVPSKALEPLSRLAQNLFICPPSIAQHAAVASLSKDSMAIHEKRRREFAKRCNYMTSRLHKMGFTIPVVPEGAFYVYADMSFTGLNSEEFCRLMIEKYKVAITPGSDFAERDAGRYVRFAYTTDMDSIVSGLDRIEQALNDLDFKCK